MKLGFFKKISNSNIITSISKSISAKMFLATAIIMFIFITGTLFLQSIFFQDFYTKSKVENLEKKTSKFNLDYTKSTTSSSDLYSIMSTFEEQNNARIVIVSSTGKIKFLGDNKFENDQTTSRSIDTVLDNIFSSDDKFNRVFQEKQPYTYIIPDNMSGTKNIACIIPVSLSDSNEAILAVSSLQPVSEASDVIKEFYVYMLAGLFVIVVILAVIYSNIITKPLVRLNKTAVKMSHMDFSEKCILSSKDEIGSLAGTLNFLSANLQSALNDLQERNEQLEKDIEKERFLERMRKEFVAGVSHELKTPIALISGYAEGIKDNIVSEESKKFYIEVIMDEASKMSQLVSDMLDLSQLESGNFKLKVVDLFVDQLLRKTISKHQQFIYQKNIQLILNIQEDLLVEADELRIEQVITNFINNAIRHTPENGTILVNATEATDSISISIENSGEKIPEDEIVNIWNKFYKIDKSRTRNMGGTGLGLSIVKNILLLHGSSFGAYNTENGVCFFFTLSRAISDER